MPKLTYDRVLEDLQRRKVTLRCDELIAHLEFFKFSVKPGANGKHHTFTHTGLSDFHGSNFDCGHGRNPQVLPVYIGKVIKLLSKYEDELRILIGDEND